MIKKILLGLLTLIIILAVGGFAYYRLVIYQPPLISQKDRLAIKLMPLPAKLELAGGYAYLSNGIQVNYLQFENEKITKSVDRFISRLDGRTNGSVINENGIELNINCTADSPTKIQQLKEDEAYSLKIDKKQILLEAPSPYGVIRGLETLYN